MKYLMCYGIGLYSCYHCSIERRKLADQEWRIADVFKRMWIDGLSVYDKKSGIDWKWQYILMVLYYKGTFWGKSTGANFTDRSKSGTK